jgi:hypothetical protein
MTADSDEKETKINNIRSTKRNQEGSREVVFVLPIFRGVGEMVFGIIKPFYDRREDLKIFSCYSIINQHMLNIKTFFAV